MARETAEATIAQTRPKPRLPRVRTFSSLRNRDYRYLWAGNLFNNGANWLLLSMLAVALIGFAQTAFRTSNGTLVQTLVPDALRGRVLSIYHLDHGLTPLASFVVGLFGELYNPTGAVTVIGLLSLGLSTYFLLALYRIRQLE